MAILPFDTCIKGNVADYGSPTVRFRFKDTLLIMEIPPFDTCIKGNVVNLTVLNPKHIKG